MSNENNPPTLFEWLGLNDPRKYPKGFGHFIGFFFTLVVLAFAALFVMAFAAAFVLVFGAFTGQGATLGLGALLVALLGAPFLIWRTVVAQNTLDTARKEAALKEEALFNDKINAAAKDLAARRQVTEQAEQDGKQTFVTKWEDDLVTRAAAIDLLEGLANERPDAAPRIARQLSIYVRELSRQYPAKEPPKDPEEAELIDWSRQLRPFRTDVERAAQALGRLHDIQGVVLADTDLDLREANLQGFDLNGLTFPRAQMAHGRMEGAKLSETKFVRANLFRAQFVGTYLNRTVMNGADLSAANFKAAWLLGTQLRAARLWRTEFNVGVLSYVDMRGAELERISMPTEAVVEEVNLSGAYVSDLSEHALEFLEHFFEQLYCDTKTASRVIGAIRPAHWPTDEYVLQDELTAQWRAWAATLTPPVTIAPDYRDKDPT